MIKNIFINSPSELAKKSFINSDESIHKAVKKLDKIKTQILLVINKKTKKFLGTITDGDIRRGILKGVTLESPLTSIINKCPYVIKKEPTYELLIEAMQKHGIRQIPCLDRNNKITGLFSLKTFVQKIRKPNHFLIMAGGMGSRLRPLTFSCPKPLLRVAGKPILEHIITKAKNEGFSKFIISVHYLGSMIKKYFGDGSKNGVEIKYINEKTPLGTAGAIGFLKNIVDEPFIMTNGDVLTDFPYENLLEFHQKQNAFATMAVQLHQSRHPFGVVKTKNLNIVEIEEKPILKNYINAGVYVFNPKVTKIVQKNKTLQIPELFKILKNKKKKILACPIYEQWNDLGIMRDLKKTSIIYKKRIKKYENSCK